MESLGSYLRTERESQNLSLKEVSESTRIKERLLQAIEEDQYELLSSPVYAKGFLDAYARYLHLDRNDILLRYQQNHENKILPKEPKSKQSFTATSYPSRWITSRKKSAKLWLLIGSISGMILFLGISLYYVLIKPM